MTQAYAVFCGIDVGKGEHHAVGLDPSGKRLFDKALPNDESRLRAVFDQLAARGPLLIVVDQPNTIGALPVTVARACGHDVAYLPGLSMRRIADLYPGQAKTDARDARIIADAARTMPHTLRRVDVGDETLTELGVLVGFDDDLAGEATRTSNRIRGLLTSVHPALERVLAPRVAHPAVLEILSRCGGPAGIRAAGRRKLTAIATKHAPRMGARLVEEILAAARANGHRSRDEGRTDRAAETGRLAESGSAAAQTDRRGYREDVRRSPSCQGPDLITPERTPRRTAECLTPTWPSPELSTLLYAASNAAHVTASGKNRL